MFSILLACLIVIAVLMVAVILLQKSEGSGMSGSQAASMFGGALTGASAGNFFTKLTAWLATIFFVICAALAFIVSKQGGGGLDSPSEVREILEKDTATAPAAGEAVVTADTETESLIPDAQKVPTVPEN
ncbi:MAG: preprotein translocase subunit SecG [Rickettsiales bacterium]|jgi:preprotein translocase subunit SecG|nr:preprotein translocase subunit SecG [Rickettsiales bacterium]